MTTTNDTSKEMAGSSIRIKTYDDLWSSNIIDNKITFIMRQLNMGMHIKGYQYVKKAIELLLEDPTYMHMITKRLYVDVAKEFGTTASRVERAIRTAIDSINCNARTKCAYIGYASDSYTNSEFITAVAELLRCNMEQPTE